MIYLNLFYPLKLLYFVDRIPKCLYTNKKFDEKFNWEYVASFDIDSSAILGLHGKNNFVKITKNLTRFENNFVGPSK